MAPGLARTRRNRHRPLGRLPPQGPRRLRAHGTRRPTPPPGLLPAGGLRAARAGARRAWRAPPPTRAAGKAVRSWPAPAATPRPPRWPPRPPCASGLVAEGGHRGGRRGVRRDRRGQEGHRAHALLLRRRQPGGLRRGRAPPHPRDRADPAHSRGAWRSRRTSRRSAAASCPRSRLPLAPGAPLPRVEELAERYAAFYAEAPRSCRCSRPARPAPHRVGRRHEPRARRASASPRAARAIVAVGAIDNLGKGRGRPGRPMCANAVFGLPPTRGLQAVAVPV